MKRIFCLEEKPSSDEHVFPEAIGGTLHIDRVCESCSNLRRRYKPLLKSPLGPTQTVTMVVSRPPEFAGVGPYNKLIDRNSGWPAAALRRSTSSAVMGLLIR
jgi:hypothetical protein